MTLGGGLFQIVCQFFSSQICVDVLVGWLVEHEHEHEHEHEMARTRTLMELPNIVDN